jgi:hypothetical protein
MYGQVHPGSLAAPPAKISYHDQDGKECDTFVAVYKKLLFKFHNLLQKLLAPYATKRRHFWEWR